MTHLSDDETVAKMGHPIFDGEVRSGPPVLTNGFSKKVENHGHAVALYFAYYNFVRVHQTLRVTPAMEAGLSDHVWSVEELVSLLPEPEAKKRGPYKKTIPE
jgi:hypothetical protein